MKKYTLFLLLFLLLPSVLANGLQVVSISNTNINKVVGTSDIETLIIQNQEAYTFYNITLSNPDIISPISMPQLLSGQNISIPINITANTDFSGTITVSGYYTANIGSSNVTYPVSIVYPDGMDKCDFTVIQGDKVTWINNVLDSIDLKNIDTNINFITIAQSNNYTTTFDSQTALRYAAYRRGVPFSNVCTITAIGTSGLVNDPQLNAKFNLTVKNTYPSTNLTLTLLVSNYTMNFTDTQEGILALTNNGNYIAHNVFLSMDWSYFNKNNFDINPGQTVALSYDISPSQLNPKIILTNQTDKQYNKVLNITGNFQTINQDVGIFINYAEISSNISNASSNLSSVFAAFCLANPTLCDLGSRTIYIPVGNSTQDNITLQLQQAQVKSWLQGQFDVIDKITTSTNYMKMTQDEQNHTIGDLKSDMAVIKANLTDALTIQQQTNDSITFIIFSSLGAFLLIIVLVICFMIYKLKQKKRVE